MSGSTNASDVALRRKLEAELLEAKEGLNETYYSHAQDQRSNALDDEAEAFRTSKEKYIEELEATLDDVETLITNSLMDVLLNADTIYEQLAGEEGIAAKYGIQLSDKLTQPWKDASAQATAWKTELQNSMSSGEYAALIGEGGAITAFANGVATKLGDSWSSAQNAVKGYSDFLTGSELGNKFSSTITGFGNQIQTIIDKWNSVKKAADDAYTSQTRKVEVGGNPNVGAGDDKNGGGGGGGGDNKPNSEAVKALQRFLNQYWNTQIYNGTGDTQLSVDGDYGKKTRAAVKAVQKRLGISQSGEYDTTTAAAIKKFYDSEANRMKNYSSSVAEYNKRKKAVPAAVYAKGTMGTSRDEWMLTDEIGDELVMYATPEGTLSYARIGTTVVPADITANLVEWGKLNPDMLNLTNPTAGINMISNAVNKPEFNLSFEALVKADKIDEGTLPEVKRFVQQEINSLVKQMNYALKGVGSR